MLVHCLKVFAACANFVRFQIAESMGKYYVTTKRTKDLARQSRNQNDRWVSLV
jgi:hypothetical protein